MLKLLCVHFILQTFMSMQRYCQLICLYDLQCFRTQK